MPRPHSATPRRGTQAATRARPASQEGTTTGISAADRAAFVAGLDAMGGDVKFDMPVVADVVEILAAEVGSANYTRAGAALKEKVASGLIKIDDLMTERARLVNDAAELRAKLEAAVAKRPASRGDGSGDSASDGSDSEKREKRQEKRKKSRFGFTRKRSQRKDSGSDDSDEDESDGDDSSEEDDSSGSDSDDDESGKERGKV